MSICKTYGITKKVVFKIEYRNFEDLIKTELKNLFDYAKMDNYNFVADCEGSNDSTHSFHVGENLEKDYEYEEGIENIKEGSFGFSTDNLLAILAHHKVIEPGEYIVRVSW